MKKILIVLVLVLFLLTMQFSFASENYTSDDYGLAISNNEEVYTDSIVYFDSSVENDGNGSQSNPYKYLNSSRITTGSTLYLADGEYDVDSAKTIVSNNIIGQSPENTIISYSGNLFTVTGNLVLSNLTFKKASFSNTGNLSAYNVIFKDTSSNTFGGVIKTTYTTINSISYSSNLTVDNCTFVNNNGRYGGVIYSDFANVNINNSRFIDNNAYQGGAIFSYRDNVNIINSNFSNNNASSGGAICAFSSNLFISEIYAYNNTATNYGGFLYKMYNPITVNSSKFENNSAEYGGALFCDYNGNSFTLSYCNFTSNVAKYLGSAVYSVLNNENFTNNIFINNELYNTTVYDINFERTNYTQFIYNSSYSGNLPSKYDLRDYNYVSPVKNQGNDGNCWAFAALAALESCILKASGTVYDLSEENMKNLIALFSDYGWNMQTNNGGYDDMPVGYLTSWMGPVLEDEDHYIVDSIFSPLLNALMHVQNVVYLSRSSYTDNNAIKKAIMDYGAVFTTTYATGSRNQYYSGTLARNHAVCIVGWDDNYSRNNFGYSRPAGNGAWIVKNSWGEDWGYNGYYYVSYYDTRFAQVGDSDASFTFILNDTIAYDKIYQYDVIGKTDYLLTSQDTMWYKNSFNATSNQTLAAFSTYFNTDTDWEVEIKVNNELKLTQNGTSQIGYYTIDLKNFIMLNEGDVFEILLKIKTSSEAWVPISEKVSATRTHYYPNVSYVSYDGINWIDLYDYTLNLSSRGHTYSSSVACIKAFTIFNLDTDITVDYSINNDNSVNLTVAVLDQYKHSVNSSYVVFSVNGIEYKLDVIDGAADLYNLVLDPGTYEITFVFVGNSYYSQSNSTRNIIVPTKTNITIICDDITYLDNITIYNTLKTAEGDLIDANLTLIISNNTYNITSNSAYTVGDIFDAGNYTIEIIFNGNEYYNYAKAISNLTISKLKTNISVNVCDVFYGENIVVNNSLIDVYGNKVDREVILAINSINYTVQSNSLFTLPVLLDINSYDVYVYFKGNLNYESSSNASRFTVNKLYPTLSVNISDVVYGEYLLVKSCLNNLSEDLILSVDGRNYSFVSGVDYILPVLLNASSYDVGVYFDGNSNYYPANCSLTVNVAKSDVNLDVVVFDIVYGDDVVISTSLADLNGNELNKDIVLSVNGINYSVSANSLFTLPVMLNASSYDVSVFFAGDSNYNSARIVSSFRVSKFDPLLSIDVHDIDYGEYLVVNTSLMGINDSKLYEDIVLTINNKNYTVSSNSLFTVPVLLNASGYSVVAYFDGNSNYNFSKNTSEFNVFKLTPELSVDIYDAVYGDNLVINTSLVDVYGNLLDEDVVLSINGINYTVKANCVVSLPVILNASDYSVVAYFDGNLNYNAVDNDSVFSVFKATPSLSVNVSDVAYGDDLIVNTSLIGINGNKLNEDVIIAINGVNYTVGANRVVSLPVLLDINSYDVCVYFKGNLNYESSSNASRFTVNKLYPTLSVNISDVVYGEYLIVKSSLNNLSEDLILSVDGRNYSFVSGVDYTLPVLLNASSYDVGVYFDGNSNCYPVNCSLTVNVAKSDVNLDVVVFDIVYGDDVVISTSLADLNGNNLNKEIVLSVNGINYTVNANSLFTLPVMLNASSYDVSVFFAGDSNYNSAGNISTFTVNKFDSKLFIDVSDVVYGEYLVVNTSLIGINDSKLYEDIVLTINNINYTVGANSQFTLPVILNASSYDVSVFFGGDSNYNSADNVSSFTVSKFDPVLFINVHDIDYGEYLVVNTSLIGINDSKLYEDIVLSVNGINYVVSANSLFTLPVMLSASSYSVVAYFGGNSNYNFSKNASQFNVFKITPILLVDIPDIVYGDDLIINTSLIGINGNKLDDDVVIVINGVNYTVDANCVVSLPVLLDASVYSVIAYFEGNLNYNALNYDSRFTVNKLHPALSVNISDVVYGEYLIVKSSLNNLNEDLILSVDGKNYSFVSGVDYTLPVLLNASVYDVSVYFDGNSNCYPVNCTLTVDVAKSDVNLDVIVFDIVYGDDLVINTSLTDLNGNELNKEIVLSVNGINYTVGANSQFILPVMLNASSYSVSVFFAADSNYNSAGYISTFTVSKFDPALFINVHDIDYGEYLVVNTSLMGINGSKLYEDIVLTINNINYSVSANSLFTLPVMLNASSYSVVAYFGGNSNYKFSKNASQFNVFKITPTLLVDIPDIVYGDDLIINTSLIGINGNKLDEDVILIIDNNKYVIESNHVLSLSVLLDASTYSVVAYFDGNLNYNALNNDSGFNVFKATPSLSLNVSDVAYGDDLVISNSLIGINGNKLDEDVVIVINGVNYTVDANCVVSLPVLLDASVYSVVAYFDGNLNYNALNNDSRFTVNKLYPTLSVNVSDVVYGEYLIVKSSLNNLNEDLILSVDGRNYSFVSGVDYTLPVLLNASSYDTVVYFNGNSNYYPSNCSLTVNVVKSGVNFDVIVFDVVYGDDILINTSLTDVNGNKLNEDIILNVNNKNYTVNANSLFTVRDLLDVSSYNVVAYFGGDSNFNPSTITASFEVNPREVNLSLNISKNINNASLNFEFNESINTTLSILINSKPYSLSVINGIGSLDLIGLDLGNYDVEARFSQRNYNELILRDSFAVSEIETNINVNDMEMYYHDGTRLNIILTDSNGNLLPNKVLYVTINNIKYTRTTNSNGSTSMGLNLNSNSYPIDITFEGDDKYLKSSKNITLNIKSTVAADNLVKYYRNASQFYAQILDHDGNPVANRTVEMNINGVFYYRTTNSTGIVRLNINLNPDIYILTILNPVTDEKYSVNITVLSRIVDNRDLVKYYRNASQYSLKVLDDVGNPLSNAQFSFNINGVFYTRTSNENGIVTLNINLNPGNYIITAEYGGYRVSNSIRVLTIIETSDLVMKFRDGSKFSAMILDGHGNPCAMQSVLFNINGVFYTRTTNSEGIAYLNINLQSGKYIITSSYNNLNEANTITIV